MNTELRIRETERQKKLDKAESIRRDNLSVAENIRENVIRSRNFPDPDRRIVRPSNVPTIERREEPIITVLPNIQSRNVLPRNVQLTNVPTIEREGPSTTAPLRRSLSSPSLHAYSKGPTSSNPRRPIYELDDEPNLLPPPISITSRLRSSITPMIRRVVDPIKNLSVLPNWKNPEINQPDVVKVTPYTPIPEPFTIDLDKKIRQEYINRKIPGHYKYKDAVDKYTMELLNEYDKTNVLPPRPIRKSKDTTARSLIIHSVYDIVSDPSGEKLERAMKSNIYIPPVLLNRIIPS
jgi:hypothetical protein